MTAPTPADQDKKTSALRPWLGGLVVACAFCACYAFMGLFRQAWQSHYPDLANAWANNGRYSLIGWFGTELGFEELAYAARANNSAHNLPAYDPYIKENRSPRQLVIDGLTYTLMGAVQAVLKNITLTWIFIRFTCCLFWFVLVYHLTMRLGGPPPFAGCAAAFVTCFSYLLTLLFVDNLQWHGPALQALARNLWTVFSYGRTEGVLRLPRPGITYAFSFLAALCVIKTAEDRGWRWALVSGALGGLLAYIRLDVWSTYMAAAAFYAALYSVKERRICRPLALSLAVSGLLSLPFLWYTYPPDPDLMLRHVMFVPRTGFDWSSLPYLLAAAAGLLWTRNAAALFFACMAAGTFVMVNIELVTGYRMNPDHWKFFGNIYVFLLALHFIPQRLRARRRLWRGAAAAVVAAAFLQGMVYAAIHFPFQGLPKDYDQALDWLDKNTAKNSVVLTLNPEVNTLIPAFTHDKVMLSFVLAVVSDYPMRSNCRRLLAGLRLLGASPDKFLRENVFTAPPADRRGQVSGGTPRGQIEKRELFTMLFYMTPREAAREIMAQAAQDPLAAEPDYVWFGRIEKQYADKRFPDHALWEEVFRNPEVTLYRRKA